MTMKEKIQELCRERDISVRQLERMAGLKERTIQHWDDSGHSGNKNRGYLLAPVFSMLLGISQAISRLLAAFWRVTFFTFL